MSRSAPGAGAVSDTVDLLEMPVEGFDEGGLDGAVGALPGLVVAVVPGQSHWQGHLGHPHQHHLSLHPTCACGPPGHGTLGTACCNIFFSFLRTGFILLCSYLHSLQMLNFLLFSAILLFVFSLKVFLSLFGSSTICGKVRCFSLFNPHLPRPPSLPLDWPSCAFSSCSKDL